MSFPYHEPPRERRYRPWVVALVGALAVCWVIVGYVVWVIVEWAT